MKNKINGRLNAWLVLSAVGVLAAVAFGAGCDPIPRRQLTIEEKQADLSWVYSQFGQHYAPLDYKAARYGFSYEQIKQRYRDEAALTTNNDEFYALLKRLVSEFKDAHTSSSLTRSDLPGRAQVGYLGFSGIRSGNKFVVKELFPTVSQSVNASDFPVQPGAEITHFNGVPILEAVRSQMVWSRDLGQDEANLTFHMNRLFTRVSTENGLPKEPLVSLTLASGKEVSLPWIVRDVTAFKEAQVNAAPKKKERVDLEGATASAEPFSLLGFDGRIVLPAQIQKWIRRGEGFNFLQTFRFADSISRWTTRSFSESAGDALSEVRDVPSGAVRLAEARTYPAFVYRTRGKLVGYVLISTFSPEGGEASVVSEFKSTLNAFKELGVKEVILDTIDNGGGSLSLGMAMAQALSSKRVAMPEIQLALSDTWLDEFDHLAKSNAHDAMREVTRRLLVQLEDEQKQGKRLSSRLPTEVLLGKVLTPNSAMEGTGDGSGMKYAVLVNEMCASMCDIFAGIVQDNQLGRVVGARTMGAGGNVVEHTQAPNSHMDLRQTESLLVRKDGSYLENNGVKPDIEMDVSATADKKYLAVREAAEKVLLEPEASK